VCFVFAVRAVHQDRVVRRRCGFFCGVRTWCAQKLKWNLWMRQDAAAFFLSWLISVLFFLYRVHRESRFGAPDHVFDFLKN
jgi:hypothetical protein